MRTIKFRGKRMYGGEWVYGCLVANNISNGKVMAYILTVPKFAESFDTWKTETFLVDPATVGQFTGLTDINGKEIYDGDIVEHPYIDPIFGDLVEMKDGKGVKSVVVFHEGAFCVRYGEDVFYYLDQFTRHNHIEVISNVFDNPELMKGGEQ